MEIIVKLAVIADDLTGANDTGVQFAKQGLKTTVLFSNTKLHQELFTGEVIVLNSDSRALNPESAYETVYNISEQLNQLGVSNVFKKIDSTMRGNVGQEIDAVMDVFQYQISFVVPAFPKSNRITENGKHYVHGVPLEKTEIANDPSCPVKEGYLPKLVQQQSKRKVELITIDDVRKSKGELAQKMKALSSDQASKIVIIDATTDEDLKAIAEAAQLVGEEVMWVGSAGIAYHLCETVKDQETVSEKQERKGLPVLVVAGSVNSITDKQIQQLKKKMNVGEIVISPEQFFDETKRHQEIQRAVLEGNTLLEKGNLVISTNRSREAIERVKKIQASLGLTNLDIGSVIAKAMGQIAGKLVESKDISGAVLTGGDIAGATCKILEGNGINVIGEVEDGIPYGKLLGGHHDGLPLVTKAGAFGTEQALVKAVETLSGSHEYV
ncbi:four-carbon acid sugar kinase family protein [Alkalihalobacillus sp. BA299]|uniref:four-carbon acid sugar kinase family protein n=1 Tax=Alkalihalobacillus sp. BA299 TaxID=2815938 RepID=UPI0027DBC5BF|nr:four-carbon acid sugar kinase family protein [Alkalihalobacillus sp. BA299]